MFKNIIKFTVKNKFHGELLNTQKSKATELI
jgi:hypothetical protein